ncbi:hypothetical protein D3C77_246040 [compost metagenome]
MCIRETRIAIQAAIVQAQPTGRALQLATGGFRQCARVEQQDHRWRLLAGIGDHLTQGLDQASRGNDLLHVAADFDGNADALFAQVIDRKHRHPAFAQHLDFSLQSLFQVLRVEVMAAHDQHVLETTGDKQLPLTHETQVAGTQPGLPALFDKRLRRRFRVAPVAFGDARATGPDLADLIVR